MTVQDDERERELVRMFNLDWDHAHKRGGVDATLDVNEGNRTIRFQIEVKSTTGTTVSTARDVGMGHIRKWRRMLFVIGFYSNDARRPELRHCLCLTPTDMEPWISSIENKIKTDFKLAEYASRGLVLQDLFDICGEQKSYTLEDAKRIHKQQWTKDEYSAALDIKVDGEMRYSPTKMLEILKHRSKYISERGATLNNPHVTKSHLDKFANTDRVVKASNWAEGIRRIASNFAKACPDHPSITVVS